MRWKDRRRLPSGKSGLFVYDAKQNPLIGAVDLEELDCLDAEGNLDCEVMVSRDGTAAYIHPVGNEEMYVYDIDNKLLTRHTLNMEETEMFTHLKDTNGCVNPDYTVWRSKECVPLRKYDFFYMESGSGHLKDLSYVIEKDHKTVLHERIFPEEGQQSGENRSYDISLEEASVWPVVELPVFEEAVKQGQFPQAGKRDLCRHDREGSFESVSCTCGGGFFGEGWPAWNRCAYPEHWSDEFDSMLVANVEDNNDNQIINKKAHGSIVSHVLFCIQRRGLGQN